MYKRPNVNCWHGYYCLLAKHSIMNTQLLNTTRKWKMALGKSLAILLFVTASVSKSNAQESYGRTVNLGVGLWYYGYYYAPSPFLNLNYEFDVARNFTLAPSIGYTSARSDDYYYHGAPYYYRETFIPISLKGTYYFDRLLNAGPNWDFYLGASLGFVYNSTSWKDGYYGDRSVVHDSSPLYLDLHIGAEYHITNRTGLYLDLSNGVSTIGLAFHGHNTRRVVVKKVQ